MNCPNCGNIINNGEIFCGSCGYNVSQPNNGMNQNNMQQPVNNMQQPINNNFQQPVNNNYTQVSDKTNAKAISGFCFSIAGFFLFAFLCIPGIILSNKAKEEIAQTGEKGMGLAKAGAIIGYVDLAFWILGIVLRLAGVME